MILFELSSVCSRTVVETVGPSLRYDFEQVFVAFEVLCQEDKVITTSVRLLGFEVQIATTGNIYLAADDRLERLLALLLQRLVCLADIVQAQLARFADYIMERLSLVLLVAQLMHSLCVKNLKACYKNIQEIL